MANASGSFFDAEALSARGLVFRAWAWTCEESDRRFVPLYEAKMLSHYDHRFSTYKGATQAQLNVGSLPRLTDTEHVNPREEPLPRYWVAEGDVEAAIGARWDRQWFLGWRDIVRSTDARTFVPSVLPRAGVGDTFLLGFPAHPSHAALLQAVWSSFVFDYVARQKLSGTHMKYFTAKQLACPTPESFDQPAPWQPEITLAEYITPRVIELTYTSHRMAPYARDLGFDGPPFTWDPDRRAILKAELDAAMFHIYGLTRDEVEHVLDSFPVVCKYDERDYGEYRTKRMVLNCFLALLTQ